MDVRILCCFIFSVVGLTHIDAKESCRINLSSLRFRPFVLTSEGNFFPTQNNTVVINSGNNASVSCQKFNFEKYPKKSTIKTVCDNGKLVSDAGKILSTSDFDCELKIIDIMKCNVKNCDEKSLGLCYLYYDSIKSANVKLAEVCFNKKISRITFARVHLSRDATVNSDEKLYDFFEKIPVFRDLIGANDENTLNTLLANDHELLYDYMTVQKLIPQGILNEQLQDAVKYPINNVGLWKSVVEGNWRSVNRDIEDYANTNRDSIDLIFGTHQSLISHDGKVVYFRKNKEMIPQFVWAVAYEKKSKNGVAIITLNDPYASLKQLKAQVFCESICSTVPWLKSLLKNDNYDRPGMGYTFCCKLQDFKSIYHV
ncbi:salivary protein Tsal2A-like [Arctopsyche grandis]|uniref:salivary protein Tsal2A-like n=1 Tax=Arctopsyche grandis TaxID=121162 RepID=UPI00406D8694